jgi:limonene-1,2-epoxide hydrolase
MTGPAPSTPIDGLLTAIESRDLRRVAGMLTPDATWQNVPHPPTSGRDAVVGVLGAILCWSDDVRWDVVSAATRNGTVWCERVDRFWIDGDEQAVRCNGVFTVDPATGLVSSVRDYVDLGEWRDRLAPVLDAMARRAPAAVVARHLAAVERRDTVAMAADYALDARLDRGDLTHGGWMEIADYFDTVPARLEGRSLDVEGTETDRATGHVTVRWAVRGHDRTIATGVDRYEVVAGRIVHQVVSLDGTDF